MGFGMQLQPKRPDDFENGIEAWTTLTGKCFIKAFTRQTCISRDLCHTFGASDIAKSFGNECGIPVSFFKTSFKISSHFLSCSEVFADVIACGNDFSHCVTTPEDYARGARRS